MSFPAIRGISLQPILFSQVPTWDAALGKLNSFIDADTCAPELDRSNVKGILSGKVVPFLRARFPAQGQSKTPNSSPPQAEMLSQWNSATVALSKALPLPEMFPLVDFWRLGLLDVPVSSWVAAAGNKGTTDVTDLLLHMAISVLEISSPSSRNLILITLRLLANGFANTSLARHLLDPTLKPSRLRHSARQNMTDFLVPTLLHADAPVRTAAASLAFNIAAHYQRPLVEAQRNGKKGEPVADSEGEGQGDWEVEIVSAVVEALAREKQSEDVGEYANTVHHKTSLTID
jgi:desumoylating isopeptidase 1